MEIFNKKTNEPIEVEYRPKTNIVKTYKITISEVTIYEKEEIEGKYINPETKNIVSDYDYRYELTEEEKKNFVKVYLPTGATARETKEVDVYEQIKDNLDISDVSIYINRK